jgi:hypothetical protein
LPELFAELLDIFGAAQIGDESLAPYLWTGELYFPEGGADTLPVTRTDDNVASFRGQPQGNRFAKTIAGGSYQRGFAFYA